MVSEVGENRVIEKLEGRAALLRTRGQHGPDSLAPAAAGLAAGGPWGRADVRR